MPAVSADEPTGVGVGRARPTGRGAVDLRGRARSSARPSRSPGGCAPAGLLGWPPTRWVRGCDPTRCAGCTSRAATSARCARSWSARRCPSPHRCSAHRSTPLCGRPATRSSSDLPAPWQRAVRARRGRPVRATCATAGPGRRQHRPRRRPDAAVVAGRRGRCSGCSPLAALVGAGWLLAAGLRLLPAAARPADARRRAASRCRPCCSVGGVAARAAAGRGRPAARRAAVPWRRRKRAESRLRAAIEKVADELMLAAGGGRAGPARPGPGGAGPGAHRLTALPDRFSTAGSPCCVVPRRRAGPGRVPDPAPHRRRTSGRWPRQDAGGGVMNETVLTVVGNVASDPQLRVTTSGARVGSFRLASTERRYDKALSAWRDGDTDLLHASRAGGRHAENVVDSLEKGQPVVVHGRFRHRSLREGRRAALRAGDRCVHGRPRPHPGCRQVHQGDRSASRRSSSSWMPRSRSPLPGDERVVLAAAGEEGRQQRRLTSSARPGGREDPPAPTRLAGMAEFIYTMRKARKAHGDKVILDDVTLSFLPGREDRRRRPQRRRQVHRAARSWPGSTSRPTATRSCRPGYSVGILAAGAAAQRGQGRPGQRRGGRRRDQGQARPLQRDRREDGRSSTPTSC